MLKQIEKSNNVFGLVADKLQN